MIYELSEKELQDHLVVIGEGIANQYMWVILQKLRDFDFVIVQATHKYMDKMELVCNILIDACKFEVEYERQIKVKSKKGYSLIVDRGWLEKHRAIKKY